MDKNQRRNERTKTALRSAWAPILCRSRFCCCMGHFVIARLEHLSPGKLPVSAVVFPS